MKAPSRPLARQVALISGGAGDIGLALADAFAAQGARVALGDVVSPARARARVGPHHYTQVDVADPAAIASWLRRVERALGVPTLIVPNAAIVMPGGALETSTDVWRRTVDVNLSGAFFLAQAAARRLVAARRRGHVIFVGSWAAHAPHPGITAYSVAKAGLRMAMQCLALELAPHGILVNEVAPGRVDAGLSRRLFDENPGFRERARAGVPVGALLEPADVARAVVALCRPDNRQMTGSVVLLDGGLSLVRGV
jgi:NAD(P)-dependent dehydrogenase (short-subunit alcohol dehydrogenase family)